MLDGLLKEAAADPRLGFLYGLTCARIGAYDRAEAAFNTVLVQQPDDFDVLFNLGRAAARARHYDRALRAFEVALKLQPNHVDSLLELAEVNAALHDYPRAIYLLANAKQLAPARPEIPLALAHTAQAGEYYGDAAIAYDEYLRLRPADDTARRDRALIYGYTGTRLAEGLKELAWYIQKHPDDPLGYYDLAQLTWRDHPQEALDRLATALAPGAGPGGGTHRPCVAAQSPRPHGRKPFPTFRRQSKSLLGISARSTNSARLTSLSTVPPTPRKYSGAQSPSRRTIPKSLMHLGRALMELGREEEARQLLVRFQKIRPARVRGPWKQPGMIESASLAPAERSKREIERLRQDARDPPG